MRRAGWTRRSSRASSGRSKVRAKSRRRAREVAVQTLYAVDVGRVRADWAVEDAIRESGLAPDLADYARRLVVGVQTNRSEIDARLSELLEDWSFNRLAAVDRAVLRMAACELLHFPGIPPRVTLDEAIDIAKKFSTADSGRFVNGVLARLLENSDKAHWDPSRMETPPDEEEPPEPEPEEPEEQPDELEEEPQPPEPPSFWRIREATDQNQP
ncbi:MAG: transcription antitermination factor NusB [Fimbriimonadales bacterium]|nr:transcription antitermination factor NusB [Fimbriimonadales bacterium]